LGSWKPISAALRTKKACGICSRDAGAVAGARIGADRAAMLEIAQKC